MYKTFKFKAYHVYDSTDGWIVTEFPLQTIEAAKNFIKMMETDRRTKHQIYSSARPFEPHRYMIEELIGTVEMELPEDEKDYEPSFYELCEVADKWRRGKYFTVYNFDDHGRSKN